MKRVVEKKVCLLGLQLQTRVSELGPIDWLSSRAGRYSLPTGSQRKPCSSPYGNEKKNIYRL
jgi:hypothetical protein